jgi:hypothetical protein
VRRLAIAAAYRLQNATAMRWSPLLLFCVACTTPSPDTSSTEQELNGMEGMFEFAIDLPWRMEPHSVNGVTTYDRVPITIVIDDEDTNAYSGGDTFRLFDFCKLTLSRYRNGQAVLTETFQLQDLEWIELTRGYWPTEAEGLPDPNNAVCHPHTEDCGAFTRVHDTSEWHALLAWNPGPVSLGASETLELTAYVSGDDNGCDSHPIKLRNYARAYWAGYPLPRFQGDDHWLYGDLHYHSQSTDNEGESGYSYRATVQAMGALGLDFTFATDHASSSEQIVEVDHHWLELDPLHEHRRGVRDMNQPRWDWAESALHGPQGANHELEAGWPADRARVPRLFLGAEVDVAPEIDYRPSTLPDSPFWHLAYGDQRDVDLAAWIDDGLITVVDYPDPPTSYLGAIPNMFRAMLDANGHTEYELADIQGPNTLDVGRDHLLYIPRFAQQPLGLVPSLTGLYGGATRRLVEDDGVREGVLPEIGHKEGIAFLAHPLAVGGGNIGPGILPYSDYQYRKMFDQRALVGLQLWNEDERVSSAGGDYAVTGYAWLDDDDDGTPMPGWWLGAYIYVPMYDLAHWGWGHVSFDVEEKLHNGAYVWDRMLRWGLDQGRTRGISWLPAGEPRRMFMAGGSDGHGDFNYHRNGYMRRTDSATDTAFGKVRNLVQTGTPRVPCEGRDPDCMTATSTQDQVADALDQGRFAVTDGPAVRLVVDRNRNGVVDDNDYPMGSVVDLYNGEALPILVQWESTPEFGDVASIDLYVGADSDAECPSGICPDEYRARTYAPPVQGVRRDEAHRRDLYRENIGDLLPADPSGADCDASAGPCVMNDGYWRPKVVKNGTPLRIVPDSTHGLFGTQPVTLNLDAYPTAFGTPTRAYVRAFAKTRPPCDPLVEPAAVAFSGLCVSRYGFTNPVWALRKTVRGCPSSDRALDRDYDGLPDFCDAAPDTPASLGKSRAFGGGSNDVADAVAFDSSGDSFVAGSVIGSGRIERDAIATTPFSASGSDALLVKYDPSGRYTQHIQALGSGSASFTDVVADALGNIYVAGTYTGQMILGGTTLTASDTDAFVAKLRGSDLAVQWVYRLGGAGDTRATALAVTGDGRVSVAGAFAGTLTFPGSVASEGKHDCFVIRLSVSGVQQSIQRFGGAGDCTATGIALDANERAYAAVTYGGALRVGTLTRTSASTDSAIVRLGNPGETYAILGTSWLGDPASSADDDLVTGVAVTSSGVVVAVGSVLGRLAAAVDGGSFVALDSVIGPTGRDGFIVTLAATDGAVSLPPVSRIGGTADDSLEGIATDSAGHVVIAGWFNSTTVTTPAGTLGRGGTTDTVMLVLDPTLAIAWQRRAGVAGVTTGTAAACSRDGRFAVGGKLTSRAQIDDTRTLITAGGNDGFIAVFRTP